MKQQQIFKMRSPIQFVLLFAFTSILPLLSIIEIVTTGSIDLNATGSGRAGHPKFLLYIAGWVCFLLVIKPVVYAARYQMHGHVFQLTPDCIEVRSTEYPDHLVQALRIRHWWRDAVLISDGKAVRFHPDWTAGGVDVLRRRFADKIVEA